MWNDTETDKLISLYKARCRDVGNVKYSNRDEKEKVYAEIDDELIEIWHRQRRIQGLIYPERKCFLLMFPSVCPLCETWQNIGRKQCFRNKALL